jgi:uncharacterized protein
MPTATGNGKICYLEIPAQDVGVSSAFYRDAFGWTLRTRGDGSLAFDDGVGEVSGTWVLHRPPMAEVGIVIYIMVDDALAVSRQIAELGGDLIRPVDPDQVETFAWFRDPAGNVLGIYQE